MSNLISLFSGCGGLDLGMEQAGFNTVLANDNAKWCEKTFAHNFPNAKFFTDSIDQLVEKIQTPEFSHYLEDIKLVAGGPPCPPFSKSRFYRKELPRGMEDDSAKLTINSYFKIVELANPQAFIFENVPGMAFKSNSDALNYIIERGEELGFKVNWKILNSADYGVPQQRKRFFLVGLKSKKFIFPDPTHSDFTSKNYSAFCKPWVTAGDAISDLDTEENADDKGHYAGGKHNHLLKDIPPGQNYLFYTKERNHPNPLFKWRSRYWSFLLKLSPDLPSWTIQARRSNNMGPLHWRNRILRIEEVKRLQSFPDDWFLEGTVEQQWRQIGNAVPPKLAKALGKALIEQL